MQLENLVNAVGQRPGERVVHVTNYTSAMLLRAKVMDDASYKHRVILNAQELNTEIESRRYKKWVANPLAKAGGVARAVASAPTVKIGDAEFGMGNLANVDKEAAVASAKHEAIFVFENSIDSEGFGRLLSYYSSAEPDQMPTFVIAADKEMGQLQTKLSPYKEKFVFHETYGSTSQFWSSHAVQVPMSLSDMVKGLIANNTLSVANSNFSLQNISGNDFEEVSQKLSAAYAVIRSINFEYNKFASADLTSEALHLLDQMDETRLSGEQCNSVRGLRILFILWDLFLNEDKPHRLDEAITLSSAIESPILRAHCLRLINLSAGYSEFSRHSLEEAEMIFRRANQEPMAIYCKNNALLNVMHQEGRTTDQFSELIDEALDKCPTMFSMMRLLNNAGVGAMLDSRFDQALEFYEKSRNFNAVPIQRLGLDTNRLLCQFMMGDSISAEDLDRLVNRMDRANMDRRYAYHQSIILFNLMNMQERLGYSSSLARELLQKRAFMDYSCVLEGATSFADFLGKNLPTTAPQKKYKGQRGDFILRTDLVPIIHFGWS